jgi:hypothetical protein
MSLDGDALLNLDGLYGLDLDGLDGPASAASPGAAPPPDVPAHLWRSMTPDGEAWIILGSAAVRVNGEPLDVGIRVLRDRDELRAGDRRAFFSTESLAKIVPFPGGERPTFCPRSRLEITPGSPAVACPQCKVWHHQSEELPCWTYSERCATCDQSTALDAGFRWTPECL